MFVWSARYAPQTHKYSLEIIQRPFLPTAIYEVMENACAKSGHLLCGSSGSRVGQLLWKIPVGRPKRDEEGFLDNSVNSLLMATYSRIDNWVDSKNLSMGIIPVTEEDMMEFCPDMVESAREMEPTAAWGLDEVHDAYDEMISEDDDEDDEEED